MNNLQNLRSFEIKSFWPTNNLGSRLKIIDLRSKAFWFKIFTKTLNKDYKYNSNVDQALNYLESIWIKCIYQSDNILLSDNFEKDLI